MKKYGIWFVLFLCVAFLVGYSVTTVLGKEETKVDRKEVFTTIQKGYEVQFSIRGKHLTVSKMYDALSPYFTDNFLQVFTDENSNDDKKSGEYLFPTKEAPFSFSSQTKLAYDEEHGLLYVYERTKNEQYQIVTLQKDKGKWKLAGYHESQELLTEMKKLQELKEQE
ncbi:hypothetical protein CON65_07140 [Bacillus pseudomycoides]|uniref:DUF3993 domain-containing protein n=1 Tax=Bacillus pseudomycoides TaxID=64104 RepID=A0AA91VE63_9BACI|nr:MULTISPECIES: DUF3993 domain-containing protein [Bacillus]PEB54937.1 hypothetical protein COO03_02975 [Bacillus sp. AFS098217]PED83329.1 hypothetical protein CON65_07140 [Bacillus pseudomycoides]PEU15937.1 hypothetical protein CN524_06660 [Bacillus sp. AFS019443]PEU20625.1 hypothetical protein CN525_04005 [Bacillus sp. AFS014408]PFW60428.1 hypothetical protein COL20_21975 [Bacillus sp. AFS075034]